MRSLYQTVTLQMQNSPFITQLQLLSQNDYNQINIKKRKLKKQASPMTAV